MFLAPVSSKPRMGTTVSAQTPPAADNTSQTTYSFASTPIGVVTGHNNRIIAVVAELVASSAVTATCTIGGMTATQVGTGVRNTADHLQVHIFYLRDNSAATSATVAVSLSASGARCKITPFAIYNVSESTPFASVFVSAFTSGQQIDTTISLPTGGAIVAGFMTGGGTLSTGHTWSGLTENSDTNPGGTSRCSYGSVAASATAAPNGSYAISAVASGSGVSAGTLAAVVFR